MTTYTFSPWPMVRHEEEERVVQVLLVSLQEIQELIISMVQIL